MITSLIKLYARSGSHVIALIFLTGCAVTTPNPTATFQPTTTPTLAPTVTPIPTATAVMTATPKATQIVSPTNTPSTSFNTALTNSPRVEIVAENLGYPDFFSRAPDGTIYISDYKAGTIQKFKNGKVELVVSNLIFPECVIALSNDSLAIMENGKERLIRYDLNTKRISVVATFINRTGLQGGIDDFAFDPQTQNFIVPDTPNGIVWRVSLNGKTMKEIASGFKQPASAYIERDGSILITDKGAGTIKRIRSNDKVEMVIAMPYSPDGAISDEQGNIFSVTLQDSAIHLLRAGSQKDEVYVTGLKKPAAPMWDEDGNLLIVESGAGRLTKILIRNP